MSDRSKVFIAITGDKLVLKTMIKELTPFFTAEKIEIFSGFEWLQVNEEYRFCAFHHPNMVWNESAEAMWQSVTTYAKENRVPYVFYRMGDTVEDVVTDYYHINFFHLLSTADVLHRIIERSERLQTIIDENK